MTSRPAWLYDAGCCELWTPAAGCPEHTGLPAMSLAARGISPSVPAYEPSEDLNFILADDRGRPRDVFTFYGPWSAGLELAVARAELCGASELTAYSAL